MNLPTGYSPYERFDISRDGAVLTVEIKGTTSMNLIDGTLHRELSEIWSQIRLDRQTTAVVLTGAGGRAFSAGGEMSWFAGMDAEEKDIAIAEGRRIVIDMLEVPQPIIAAVNGPAVGLGATVALFSDIVIAADNAIIADPHVALGMVAGDGGAIIWPWLLGVNRAKEFLFTGDSLDAVRALELGLVNRVVPASEVKDVAHALARRIAAHSPMAVQGTKTAVNALLRDAANTVLATSLAIERRTLDTPQYAAAVDKFLAAQRR
ncbi:Enoyl-CoA hydratase/isomerase [Mycolicibacterium rhodesiae JS60]|nr:Enoyl-CoA hydratase/isomerase [Mycolicibacterium rhodesiae JS60]